MKRWMPYLLVLSLCPIPLQGQDSAEEAVARLRSLQQSRNHEAGFVEGKTLVERFPDDLPLRAWFIHHMAVDSTAGAVAAAEEMAASHETSPWSWFALAGALGALGEERRDEALSASEKALQMLPGHADVINTRAEVLYGSSKEDAIAFVDRYRTRVDNPARLLVVKGDALYHTSEKGEDEERFGACLEAFEEARKADPGNANAAFRPAVYLASARRYDEADSLYRKAVQLAPTNLRVRRYFWRMVQSRKDRTLEEKIARIESDADLFLDARGRDAPSLLAVYNAWRSLEAEEKARSIADRILGSHGESPEAEWILVHRYRAVREAAGDDFEDPEQQAEYRSLLKSFIARPAHFNENLLGDAYRELFHSIREDSTVTAEEIRSVVRGMVQHEKSNPRVVFAQGAIALAERTPYHREAEQIARDGVAAVREKLESNRPHYDSEESFEKASNWMNGAMADALGWVLFQAGRLEEGERELLRAYELNPEDVGTLHHLGRLFEETADLGKAEEFYRMGVSVQSPRDNPNEQALESLYLKRHGSLTGYDEYLEALEEADRETRKQQVLSSRIEVPEPAIPFDLQTLEETRVSLASLKGRVVAINFWGIWCGWCVKEMPDFQKLYEHYEDDPEVAILTINNDRVPEAVPPWMNERGYDFPVLLDDGYVDEADVNAFPTTWFLNREGQIAFEKQGWTKELEEEFGWRIEALREQASFY